MALGITVSPPLYFRLREYAMTFGTDIRVPQKINPTNFGDPLSFPLAPL